MTVQEIAIRMYPFWLMGIFMLYATWKSKFKDLLRIDKKALLKWSLFLVGISIYRILTLKYYMQIDTMKQGVNGMLAIPWQMTLTVFWEDACHGLPLVILKKLIGTKKWTWPIHALAFSAIAVSFGLGHLYQGVLAAIMLSFYIPMSMKIGQEKGFGTVMIGHILYDLSTILAGRYAMGIW